MSRFWFAVTSLMLGAVACDDLEPRDDGALDPPPPVTAITDAGADAPGGVEQTLTIDATSDKSWVFVDLETAQQVTGAEPGALRGWDIALQRFKIKLNGGVSGSAGVSASVVSHAYEMLSQAPTEGWDADRADGSDSDLEPDYLLSVGDATMWYDYGGDGGHKLTPKPQRTYAVKSGDGKYFKLAVLNYYNTAGSSGYPQIKWTTITAPTGPTAGRDAGSAIDETTSASKPADAGT